MRLAIAAALAVTVSATAAGAAILSENFNNPAFSAGGSFVDFSDRFGTTTYSGIANVNGWTFTGDSLYAVKTETSDGALLLNERNSGGVASHGLTGLVAGKTYRISFLLSGDNRPGQTYVYKVGVDGTNLLTGSGVDGASGANPGTTIVTHFVASGPTATLQLSQASLSEASPMFDNVSVAVPEPATWAMLLAGFGLVGTAARRRRLAAA